MKKLIALLGSMSIIASSVTVVGFEYANLVKSSVEAKIRNYINVSSLLARGTILSQKSVTNKGTPTDGKDFSLNYSSKYLYGKKIGDFFDETQFKNSNETILKYLGSMFNLGSSQTDIYTVKNNPNFEVASPSLHLQDDVNTGKSGEDTTLNTVSLIGSFLPIILDSDFSAPTSAGFLENILGAGESPIKGLLEDGTTFKMIQEILFDQGTSLFTKINESLSENDIADQIQTITFDEVFKLREVGFWQGIAEILFSGEHASDTETEFNDWMDGIKNAGEGNYAEKAIPADGDKSTINVQLNKILIDGITRILPYLRTLFNYIQSFSEVALPLDQITDYNHLFSGTESNGIFVANQLRKNYLNPNNVIDSNTPQTEIVQWVKNQNQEGQDQYHQVLNLQDLIQFVQQLLTADLKNDAQGFRNARILAILLEMPLTSDNPDPSSKDDSVKNPVFDRILEPLLIQIVKKFVPSGGLIAVFIPNITPSVRAVLSHNHNFWDPVPGAPETYNSVLKVLNFLKTVIGFINIPGLKETLEELIEEVQKEQELVENENLPVEKQIFGQPFKTIFNGELLPKVFKIVNDNFSEHNPDTPQPISDEVQKICKSLAVLLTTNLGDVLKAFGLDIGTLPIYLYGVKDLSLTDIINSFADWAQTNLDKTLKENQSFLFNLDSIKRIMETLNAEVKIEFSGEIPEPITEAGITDLTKVNLVNAVLISFAYNNEITNLTINSTNEEWKNNLQISKYGFLLGIRAPSGSGFEFAKGSAFYALAQIYGHENDAEPKEFQVKNVDTLKIVLRGLSQLISWFNNFSVPLYIQEIFDPYFNSKNWSTELIKARNLDQLHETAIIDYFLFYKNPDTHQTSKYEVKLSRDSAIGEGDEWTEMGAWKIASINLKK